MTISQLLYYKQQKGYSLDKLSELSGVPKGTLQKIFSGETKSPGYETLKALEEVTGEQYETLNIIGGGSKNMLLNELTMKYTGKKIITGPTEGTAIGNLMMQMIGGGDVKDVKEGRQIVKNSFDIAEL